jgi:hypothetical protein
MHIEIHDSVNMHIWKPGSEISMQAMCVLGDLFISEIYAGIAIAAPVLGAEAIAAKSRCECHSRKGGILTTVNKY